MRNRCTIQFLTLVAMLTSPVASAFSDIDETWKSVQVVTEDGSEVRVEVGEGCDFTMSFVRNHEIVSVTPNVAKSLCLPMLNTLSISRTRVPEIRGSVHYVSFKLANEALESEPYDEMRVAQVYFIDGRYCGYRVFAADQTVIDDAPSCGMKRWSDQTSTDLGK